MRRMAELREFAGPAGAGAFEHDFDFVSRGTALVREREGVDEATERFLGAGIWIRQDNNGIFHSGESQPVRPVFATRQVCLHNDKHKIDRSVYFLVAGLNVRTIFTMKTDASPAVDGSSPKREQLMETAWRLFYRDGYRAVGIDTLLAEAKVAKMTLYNHFASKDELIVAILEKRSQQLLDSVNAGIEAAGASPQKQLLEVFEGLKQWFASEDFKGCAFIRALSEYPEPSHPIHQAAWKHKRGMNARIREIVADAGVKNPAPLADTISLLIDGSIIAAHATGSTESARTASNAAVQLLTQTLGR